MTKARLLSLAFALALPVMSVEAASIIAAERAIQAADYTKALEELKPLAKEGDLDALYLMGTLYRDGQGVEKSKEDAKQYFSSAARQGHLDSINALRVMRNEVYLAEFTQLLPKAEAGDADAQNRVGEMYEFGQGVERDLNLALQWFDKASHNGSLAGLHNLARSYNFGSGTEQNFAQAEKLYLQATEAGYTESMFFLGTLYATGNGNDLSVNPDITAYAWMKAAANAGSSTAQTIEARLLMKLSETEQSEAKALAEKLSQQYIK